MATLRSLPDLPDPSGPSWPVPGYQLTLEMRHGLARVSIVGVLDDSAADAIGGIINCDGPVIGPVEITADGLTSVDTEAFQLVVAAARERHQHGLPAVTLVSCTEALTAALARAGLPATPPVVLAGPRRSGPVRAAPGRPLS